MFTTSLVKILSDEETSDPPTVFMNGLRFINVHWQLLHINLEMVKCHTEGSLTFRKAKQFFISNSTTKGLLNVFNSSGRIENITTTDNAGLIVQNYSHVQITKSRFVNNIVKHPVVEVRSSSTIIMSDCTVQNSQGGGIVFLSSFVQLTDTSFIDNKADWAGGAIFAADRSFMRIQNCTFRNDWVKSGEFYSYKNVTVEIDQGGAIFLAGSSAEMHDVNFIQNTATFGAAIDLFNYSMINVSGLRCKRESGYSSSCISASEYCRVLVYNSTFSSNNKSVVSINNSSLLVVGSSFFNNSTPLTGGAIYSDNSTLDISHSIFYHNRVEKGNEGDDGGAMYLTLSTATVNNCTFYENSNAAVVLVNYTKVSVVNSTFQNNSCPCVGGAMFIKGCSVLNVSHTKFGENSAVFGGAVSVEGHSSLFIMNCSFSDNAAIDLNPGDRLASGGAIFIEESVVDIFGSHFKNNSADFMGGSVISRRSSLLINN